MPTSASNNGNVGSSGTHILVFPYPAQGHMLPLLDLTHQLLLRDPGNLTITILVTPKNLPILDPLLSTHPKSIKTLVLPFPPHPSIPPGVENAKDLSIARYRAMRYALGQLYDPLLQWFQSHPSPPVTILAGIFLGWTQRLADQLGIKRYIFSPSGAYAISLVNSQWRGMPPKPKDQNTLISFPSLPGAPKYPFSQLFSMFRNYVKGDPEMEFIRETYMADMESHGIILNTFTEFESVYLDHLRKTLGHDRVYGVGPLLPPPGNQRGGSSWDTLLSWLDSCPDQSIVYVCFGSQVVLKNEQMEALADGLKKSGVRFLWSAKKPTGEVGAEYGVVPCGFEEQVGGRGFLIRGWGPQVVILNHPAIGTFLSHCGWNSTLEAILAGVPMLTWPMNADQFINANILVDEGVATRFCVGPWTVPDADEIALKIAESVVGENRWSLSMRAKELSEAALSAIKEGGSSCRALDGFIRQLHIY